jgi:hypothetical protein
VSARRTGAVLAACATLALPVLAGCGGGGGGGTVDVGPAAAAPANAGLYVDATVRPTGSAETDAKAAAGKILDTNDPGGKIASLLEQQSAQEGHPINFQRDVMPWLGEKAGVFFTDFANDSDGAVVVEATDTAAALAFAQKSSGATGDNPAPQQYNGVSFQTEPDKPDTVFGIVDDFLVEGSLAGFKAAVDATKGDALGDSSDFKDAIGDLPDDRLGTVYSVPMDFLAAIPSDQIDPSAQAFFERTAGDSLDQPVAGSLTASADSVDLQLTGGNNGVETPESSLIGEVPSGAWLALGIGDVGGSVKRALEQVRDAGIPGFDQAVSQIESTTGASLDDLTNALGDAVVYVQGTSQASLGGALVVQIKDVDLTGRLLNQLQSLLQLGSPQGVKPLSLPGGGTGFQINDPTQAPQPFEIALQGDKLVVGYGPGSAQQALQPGEALSGTPAFTAAKGQVSSLGTDLFLSFPAIFQLAESSGASKDPGYQQAKPYLDALDYLVSGSGTENDKTEVKAVLGLKQAP